MQTSRSHWFLHKAGQSGFTLMEALLVAAIAGVIGVSVSKLGGQVFSFNRYFNNSFTVVDRAQKLLRPVAEEIRSAQTSDTGSYALEIAGTNELVFYSDIDNDGLTDRVRYYLSGTELRKDVVKPSGSPLSYDLGSAVTTAPVSGVQNAALGNISIFNYYDSTHTGGSTGEVSSGGNITSIRLVKITLYIDADLNQPPAATVVSTLVSMRNLKQQL